MRRAVFSLLLLASFTAGAVVIRDDVPDLRYRMAISEFPALADVPGEGHGVLIAPRWVLTAAHVVGWQESVDVVVVGGSPYAVDRIVVHPDYRKPPQDMIDAAIKSGDWTVFLKFMATSDDIALIELAEPVRDVAPVRIYSGSALGKVVRIMGRGATGKGSKGHHPHGPNRTDLRQGYNVIGSAEDRWIEYTFDPPPAAHPLEASLGNGDSGSPVLVEVGGEWQVAGITSWKRVQGNPMETWPGKYGQANYAVRVEHYREWIEQTIAADGTAPSRP